MIDLSARNPSVDEAGPSGIAGHTPATIDEACSLPEMVQRLIGDARVARVRGAAADGPESNNAAQEPIAARPLPLASLSHEVRCLSKLVAQLTARGAMR